MEPKVPATTYDYNFDPPTRPVTPRMDLGLSVAQAVFIIASATNASAEEARHWLEKNLGKRDSYTCEEVGRLVYAYYSFLTRARGLAHDT